jgi:hypothetical protein
MQPTSPTSDIGCSKKSDFQAVIATKYSTNFEAGPGHPHIMANFSGNGAKSLLTSVNASLRKLQTDYIDLVCQWQLILKPCHSQLVSVVRSLVGLQYVYFGVDAVSQSSRGLREGIISGYK